ncbi:putative Ras-related protein Rab-21 [Paratrimastix pyriformis]|uniref:Ras-related protein Rab-21 n=1 Tax=Paratrimastix pyriformis TaxID=342808 RepID=A0ABQ8UK62_9EUKA|nr:putative Ras-related protein Rab-21 [Paratrimastix pyriformis]
MKILASCFGEVLFWWTLGVGTTLLHTFWKHKNNDHPARPPPPPAALSSSIEPPRRKKQPNYNAKIILIGGADAGKSSLQVSMTRNRFSADECTIGAAFTVKKLTVGFSTVNLQFWDTAGRERFRTLPPMYYRRSHVAFVCFDLSNSASVEQARIWYEDMTRCLGPDPDPIPFVVCVGCKADLERTVPPESIARLREALKGAPFFVTSARTGEGISELTAYLGARFLEANPELHSLDATGDEQE